MVRTRITKEIRPLVVTERKKIRATNRRTKRVVDKTTKEKHFRKMIEKV